MAGANPLGAASNAFSIVANQFTQLAATVKSTMGQFVEAFRPNQIDDEMSAGKSDPITLAEKILTLFFP